MIIPALPLPLLGVVDAVLIPEIPFTLKGPNGLFEYLAGVLKAKGDCVICIAEGAGQVRGGCRKEWRGGGGSKGYTRQNVKGRICAPLVLLVGRVG